MQGCRLWSIPFLISAIATAAQAHQEARFVVLPAKAASEIRTHQTWVPTEADIAGAEANISQVSSLGADNWRSAIHIDHAENYYRQYLPIRRAGKKLLYVNAFCETPPPSYWRTRLVIVTDGGTCFWQAQYDPTTKTYSHLTINGRA